MILRANAPGLGAVLLVLSAALWAVHYFLAPDLAAILGGLAIYLSTVAAGTVYIYNSSNLLEECEQVPTIEQIREWMISEPGILSAVHGALIIADLLAGLWVGLTSAHPLVTIPAYCLTLLAFSGLLGALPKRLSPIAWIRLGIIVCSVLLGIALRSLMN